MRDKPDNNERVFRQDWEAGHEYDLEFIRKWLIPVIDKMYRDGQLGHVVADIGSGRFGVSGELKYPDVKIIRVDLVAPIEEKENLRQFPADLRKIDNLPFSTRRQVVETDRWLKSKGLRTKSGEPQVDTIVMSSVLNYVNFKEVLEGLKPFLKEGGRIIIFNKPGRGAPTHKSVFSPDRPKNNYELITHLENNGFVAEKVEFDGVSLDSLIEAQKYGAGDKDLNDVLMGHLLYVGRKISKETDA